MVIQLCARRGPTARTSLQQLKKRVQRGVQHTRTRGAEHRGALYQGWRWVGLMMHGWGRGDGRLEGAGEMTRGSWKWKKEGGNTLVA
jgi:hypothetical protein